VKNRSENFNYRPFVVPAVVALIMTITIIYFVNNPGGAMGARILTYKGILKMLRQHINLVVIASSLAIMTAVPLGILITRQKFRVLTPIVDSIVNITQTVPSLAVLALSYVFLGIGFKTAVFALWLYALLPILRNTSIGIQSINEDIIDAAKGMGMTPLRILTRIELPLALSIMFAGIRTSIVISVGVATLSTFIGAGGLGDLIVTGLSLMRTHIILAGAILSALLAILLDNVLGSVEARLKSEA